MFQSIFSQNKPNISQKYQQNNEVYQSDRKTLTRLKNLMVSDIFASIEDDNITPDEGELDAYKNWDKTLFGDGGGLVEELTADDSAGALKFGTSIDWTHGNEIRHIPNEELEELPFFWSIRKV